MSAQNHLCALFTRKGCMFMGKAKDDRKAQIMTYLEEHKFATLGELVEFLHYSDATVKRDLAEMDNDEQIRRTRGGAMLIDSEKVDVAYLTKVGNYVNDEEKKEIAAKAVEFIEDDMTVFIDSSSTALHLIPHLKKFHGLRVVTNSVLTATLLSEHTTVEVSIIGGMVTNKKFTVNSVTALDQLRMYHFDISFISCRGYDSDKGATENSEGEAIFKRVLTTCTDKIVLMALAEKRGKVYFYQSLKPDEIDVVV